MEIEVSNELIEQRHHALALANSLANGKCDVPA